jgi:hypothetical protein
VSFRFSFHVFRFSGKGGVGRYLRGFGADYPPGKAQNLRTDFESFLLTGFLINLKNHLFSSRYEGDDSVEIEEVCGFTDRQNAVAFYSVDDCLEILAF